MNPTEMAAMDAVEIKCTIRPDQELRAERAMEVDEDTADVRLVYFYDTPDLDLFKAGVVLRARLVKGDADDSTTYLPQADNADIARQLDRGQPLKARIAKLAKYRNHRRKLEVEIYVEL